MAEGGEAGCESCVKLQHDLEETKNLMRSMEANHAERIKNLEQKNSDESASVQMLIDGNSYCSFFPSS